MIFFKGPKAAPRMQANRGVASPEFSFMRQPAQMLKTRLAIALRKASAYGARRQQCSGPETQREGP
jgi:hypothetical protein